MRLARDSRGWRGAIRWGCVCALALSSLAGGRVGAAIRDGGIDPANLGKGDWIYSMMDATNRLGGHIASVTNTTSLMLYYKSIGVRYIIVKAGTGASFYNGCYSSPQFNAALCNAARANGIWIFGYNRSYATNTAGEVAIADYVLSQGADGFVWDAESEWESAVIGSQGPALAWAQCSQVRSNWPTKFLAHAPFPIITYHNSFPYKEFGYWCDAVMPQIYHSGWTGVKGTASGGINWSDVNWARWQSTLAGSNSVVNGQTIWWTNAIKPLAPVENVYGPAGSVLCNGSANAQRDKDVMEFIDYLSCDPNTPSPGGYNGASFWRADLHGTAQFANIAAGTAGPFPGKVNNIVIDDPRATTSGGWTAVRTFSNGAFYGNGSGSDTNSFGTNYLTKAQGTGSAYALFRPNIAVPGDYKVYQWHVYRADASTNVPHVIAYDGGTATVNANQQTNDGNWSLLGQYPFAAGTAGYVRVTDGIPEAGDVAIADGVKFVFVPPTSVPAAPTNLTASAASAWQINLSWGDAATNETGFVVSRSPSANGPYTDIGSAGRGATAFSSGGLQANTTYFYRVRATNWLGASASSVLAAATTFGPPTITAQPVSRSAVPGGTASFMVSAASPIPLRFQWRLNDGDLARETNATVLIASVQAANLGSYRALVSNDAGGVLSEPAALTFALAPQIVSPAADLSGFRLFFATEFGPTYVVEYKGDLGEGTWQALTNLAGTGAMGQVADAPATNGARFYRLRME